MFGSLYILILIFFGIVRLNMSKFFFFGILFLWIIGCGVDVEYIRYWVFKIVFFLL